MIDTKLFDIPVPSSSFIEEPCLMEENGGLVIAFAYLDGKGRIRGKLQFTKPRSYRWRAEVHCTAWHIGNSYDAVSEVIDSPWVLEISNDTAEGWKDKWVLRHFKVYLDSWGAFEVLCENYSFKEDPI